MQWDNLKVVFPDAAQYAFVYENAHLLLLSWDRDDAKFLFLIRDQQPDGLILDYPGQTFTDRVLDSVGNIFFIQVAEDGADPVPYVLGSFFVVDETKYGAYYEKTVENPAVVLFRIEGEDAASNLEVLDETEFARVSAAFAAQHADLLRIARTNHGNLTEQ